jgi:tetratricopeptide (TPR) repeat protein
LRTTGKLLRAGIPLRRVKSAVRALSDQLPVGQSLTGVRLTARHGRIVARLGSRVWDAESGQQLFDFEASLGEPKDTAVATARRPQLAAQAGDAEQRFQQACELEESAPALARRAYQRAVELDPSHFDAQLNLGRLLHEAGELEAAEERYRLALALRRGDATASFNLGVVLEDLNRLEDALEAYRSVTEVDPDHADAFFNQAGICERLGRPQEALRCLKRYRALVR